MPNISYQLYCSRNFPPLSDTLAMLARTGFRNVEGYGGILADVEAIKRMLGDNGLAMPTCHMGLDMVAADGAGLATAKALGIKTVFVPYVQPDDRPKDAKGWTTFGKALGEAGKPFRDAGIGFGWHNHDFEFVATDSGDLPQELIVAASDDLQLELDLGWVSRAGQDPIHWINKFAGRIAAVHVKDVAPKGTCLDEDGWADVGHGTMDWAAIHAALQATGVTTYVVEHDNPNDHARFAARSLATLAAL